MTASARASKETVALEEIPYHFTGEKVILADAQLSRVIDQVHQHLPFDVLMDLEDAFGDLMEAAFAYGTRCEPGDDPLLEWLSDEEYEARTGDPRPMSTPEDVEERRQRLVAWMDRLLGEDPPDTTPL